MFFFSSYFKQASDFNILVLFMKKKEKNQYWCYEKKKKINISVLFIKALVPTNSSQGVSSLHVVVLSYRFFFFLNK